MTDRGSEFDFAAFEGAFGCEGLDNQVSLYAGDDEGIESRRFSPPRSPDLMVSKQQIADCLRQIRTADLGTTIAGEVVGTLTGLPSVTTARFRRVDTFSSTS